MEAVLRTRMKVDVPQEVVLDVHLVGLIIILLVVDIVPMVPSLNLPIQILNQEVKYWLESENYHGDKDLEANIRIPFPIKVSIFPFEYGL